jgi:hypothetical protein
MAIPRSCRWWTIATFFAGLCQATTAAGADTGPVRLLDPAVAPDVVWSHAASACSNTDYSDVPVRPFYGHARGQPGRTLYWFASNSTGYLATIGVPPADGADILAKMVRVIDTNRQCATWITSGPYTEAPITPANGVPQSYNTGQWMVAPFTPDGRRVFALVHNEFHGELTAPPNAPSIYCTITQATPLPGNACGYWNIVEAVSFNGGRTFAKEAAQPPARATHRRLPCRTPICCRRRMVALTRLRGFARFEGACSLFINALDEKVVSGAKPRANRRSDTD